MNRWVILIFLIILIFFVYCGHQYYQIEESFDNPLDVKEDKIDKLYAKLFDKVFDEKGLILEESKKIIEFVKNHPVKSKKEVSLLEVGAGTGKHFQYLSAASLPVVGLERSGTLIDIFKIRNPIGKVMKGDMRNENLFKGETFDYILCLKETLYHNPIKEWDGILSNFYFWLKPGGYLVIHIFDRTKLDPAPRNITMLRTDARKRKHGITNFPNFTHDGWWEQRGKVICQYNEIYAIRDKKGGIEKKRHYKHNLAMPEKDKIIEKIMGNYFKVVDVVKLEKMGIVDHDLYFFRKNKF
jgi:SAM-dependent methyltransferase